MTGSLVIQLTDDDGPDARWVVLDPSGPAGAVSGGTLEQAALAAAGRRVSVLAPAVDIMLTRIEVPMRSAPKVVRAAPFALEEQLAEDVEHLHFAVGRQAVGGAWPVAAVRTDRLEGWLARLREAGLDPAAVVSEASCLPPTPGSVCWLLDGDRVLARSMDGLDSMAMEVDDLVDLLPYVLDTDGDAAALNLTIYGTAGDFARRQEQTDRLRDSVGSVELRQMEDDALPYLAAQATRRDTLNLLQGDYAPSTSVEILWKPWRAAAAMFAVLCLILIGREALVLNDLKGREAELDAAIQATCQEVLGNEPCVRPVFQVERVLAERLGGGGADAGLFLESLERLSAAIGSTSGTTVEAVSYRNGVMDLRVKAPSVDSLDKIRSQVSSEDLTASIQSANNQGSFVEGRLQLRRPSG